MSWALNCKSNDILDVLCKDYGEEMLDFYNIHVSGNRVGKRPCIVFCGDNGNLKLLKWLIKESKNKNDNYESFYKQIFSSHVWGVNALMYTAASNHPECAKYLIESIKLDNNNNNNWNANKHNYNQLNNTDVLKKRYELLSCKQIVGFTAIMFTCKSGSYKIMNYLLKSCITDLDIYSDKDKIEKLKKVIFFDRVSNTDELTVSHDFVPGDNALIVAAKHGHFESFKKCIEPFLPGKNEKDNQNMSFIKQMLDYRNSLNVNAKQACLKNKVADWKEIIAYIEKLESECK